MLLFCNLLFFSTCVVLSLGGRHESSFVCYGYFCWPQSHLAFRSYLGTWSMKYELCQLCLFSVFFFSLFGCFVKGSRLPSNTLSGTIWSWMMNTVYTTMGKSIPADSFCPAEHWHAQSQTTSLLEKLYAICLRVIYKCNCKALCLC